MKKVVFTILGLSAATCTMDWPIGDLKGIPVGIASKSYILYTIIMTR